MNKIESKFGKTWSSVIFELCNKNAPNCKMKLQTPFLCGDNSEFKTQLGMGIHLNKKHDMYSISLS